jgi:hypothetical protein
MAGVYVAALIAAGIVLSAGIVLCLAFVRPERRWLYALLLVLQLPMSWAAYHYLRAPLDGWLAGAVADRGTYALLAMLYAPVTEEPAKLWPLLLPFVWRRLGRENAVGVALALGLGFGIGEIGFLAESVARAPAMAELSAFAFHGFIFERVLVCVWHPAFTAVTVAVAARKPALIPLGLLGSMALHYLGNFPIYLAVRDAFGLGHAGWQQALLAWTLIYAVLMGLLLAWLVWRGRRPR